MRIIGKKVSSVHGYSGVEHVSSVSENTKKAERSSEMGEERSAFWGQERQVVLHHLWQFGRAVYAELLVHVGTTKHHVYVAS